MTVDVVRKSIKNLHLAVYPPFGRVRVAVPLAVNDDAVRLAVISKLGWIKRQQEKYLAQPRQSEREMINGESHYFMGRRYRLCVVTATGAAKVRLKNNSTLELQIRPEASAESRERALQAWYRQQLREIVPPLIKKWEQTLGVSVEEWGIKKMKTRWGTCNIAARRIWLNLELAKKPVQCLEYLIVHELAHLLERHHNDHFIAILDKHLPQWRLYRQALNSAPLAHEDWGY